MELQIINKLKELPTEPVYVVTENNPDILENLHLLETNRDLKDNKIVDLVKAIERTDAKLNKGEISDEQHKTIVDDCVEYIKSAKEVCDESKMDWSVCILLSRTNLDKYVESKVD